MSSLVTWGHYEKTQTYAICILIEEWKFDSTEGVFITNKMHDACTIYVANAETLYIFIIKYS